jgi:hypothetical protein
MSNIIGLGDDLPFELRLAETIAWCQPRVQRENLRASLRSEELQVRVLGDNRIFTVMSVVRQRGTLLSKHKLKPVSSPGQLASGRLLAYFPDEELACGAAEVASQGYFDVYNAPAHDTWIALLNDRDRGHYLIAWVPPEITDLVADGIYVNPEQCIEWLENTKVPLYKVLQDTGLLARA